MALNSGERGALLANLALVAAAFGFVEGAVVVYLREIAYPEGFGFPLAPAPALLLRTEVAREAATILLLLGVARVARRDALGRFAVFSFCFGVWDIVYYLALKAVLDWPAGLLEWDVLFLIPLPWASPVLAPVLVSLALIGAACAILLAPRWTPALTRGDWAGAISGGLLVLGSFLWNAGAILDSGSPGTFPWWLFGTGMGIGLAAFAGAIARGLKLPA